MLIDHPNNSIEDMIKISVYREANKKTVRKQKMAKNCYQFINQFIDNELNGKARLQPLDGHFYKKLDYQQNIEFNANANSKDIEKFITWIKKFTVNKVKVVTADDDSNNTFNNINLQLYYK